MYRSAQHPNIYCEHNACNQNCGLFHRPENKRTAKRSLRDRRAKQFRVQSIDIGNANGDKRAPEPENKHPQVSYLNIQQPNSMEPITPLTTFSGSSTVTLDEIILSAKRKISQDYVDLNIPSPVFMDDIDTDGQHPLAKQRNLIGGTWAKDTYNSDESSHKDDVSFVDHLVNSSDDDELWYQRDPPSIIEDGEQEDFDELLKATQPPKDHYSNPLYRKADKLTKTRRKKSDIEEDNSSAASLSIADMDLSDWDLNFALLQTRLNDHNEEKVQYEGNL